MPLRLRAVAFPADEPATAAGFWARLLGRTVVDDRDGPLVPGDGTQLGLRFVPARAPRTGLLRMHVHLTSTSADSQRDTVAAALGLDARHLDVGQRPDEGHVVLADPAGIEFCVIEPDNAFLAGCGHLGELACDGSRDVGVFWGAALQWPLVWDQDGETAVQSPQGGTKLAWAAGSPVRPADPGEAPHLELVVDGDPAGEVDRLVALGAARAGGGSDGGVVLLDPDGVAFRVLGG